MTMRLALLRGVNVGGGRKVPMAELRSLAEGLGYASVRSFIASGNLIFSSSAQPPALEAELEAALASHFGFKVDVMVRTAAQWHSYIEANPFPGEAASAPKFLMLYAGKEAVAGEALPALRARAAPEEKVAGREDAIWIFFANGGGRSKLAVGPRPGLWTGRNWRTVLTLGEMLG
ncbi:MAG TPA: DUF1697 domain-containing protein [Allosphingosinicella sp.]|nr:DUF1697 domain-containing protein [Allosphingosinicella sp.]